MSDQSDLDGIELQASHGTRHSARHDFPQPKSGLLAAGGLWRAIWLAGGIGWTSKKIMGWLADCGGLAGWPGWLYIGAGWPGSDCTEAMKPRLAVHVLCWPGLAVHGLWVARVGSAGYT